MGEGVRISCKFSATNRNLTATVMEGIGAALSAASTTRTGAVWKGGVAAAKFLLYTWEGPYPPAASMSPPLSTVQLCTPCAPIPLSPPLRRFSFPSL